MTAFMLSHVASRGAGRRLRPLEADVSSASFMGCSWSFRAGTSGGGGGGGGVRWRERNTGSPLTYALIVTVTVTVHTNYTQIYTACSAALRPRMINKAVSR